MGSCGVIRRNKTITPISAERIDVAGNIHRYNFGWLSTDTTVGGGTSQGGGGGGVVVESATVKVTGTDVEYNEKTVQEVLPPSFSAPSPDASMGGLTLNTFCKTGTKVRSIVRARAAGESTIVALGSTAYSLKESKTYAGAKGGGGEQSSCEGEGGGAEYADGGSTVIFANGVQTVTEIKG